MVSRSDLIEHIYAQDFDRDSNTVEVFIGRLRKKLPPGLIETVRGLGYRLVAPAMTLWPALRGSLRLRLLLGTLFWIAASILVAGWGLGSLFRQHVALQFHAELNTHLDQLTAQLALDDQGRPTLTLPLSDPRLSKPYSGPATGRSTASPAPAFRHARPCCARARCGIDVLRVPADAPRRRRTSISTGSPARQGAMLGMVERSVRSMTRRRRLPTLRLIVAADESLMVEPVARFNGMLWLALGVLGRGLALAALVQVFVGLAPLRACARARPGAQR